MGHLTYKPRYVLFPATLHRHKNVCFTEMTSGCWDGQGCETEAAQCYFIRKLPISLGSHSDAGEVSVLLVCGNPSVGDRWPTFRPPENGTITLSRNVRDLSACEATPHLRIMETLAWYISLTYAISLFATSWRSFDNTRINMCIWPCIMPSIANFLSSSS
jgi:hypothetical protein